VYGILWHLSKMPSMEWIFERGSMFLPNNVRIKLNQQSCGKGLIDEKFDGLLTGQNLILLLLLLLQLLVLLLYRQHHHYHQL